jgi:nucleotide-binding universal stress UspA family protein
MKTILIATDFSTASKNAAFYGTRLAKLLNARVILLNVYPKSMPSKIFPFLKDRKQELLRDSKFKLRNEIRFLNIPENVEILKKSEEGEVAPVILNVAKEVGATWIVAGIKSLSHLELSVFGSTALELSRHSEIPLILVPEDAYFSELKSIALAHNINNDNDMHVLDPLKELGEQFNSKLYIVRVINDNTGEFEEQLSKPTKLKWHLRNLDFDFEFVKDVDVVHGLSNFIYDHEINIIAMTRTEHTLFEKLFVKSKTKAMMVETQIPLIILPGAKENLSTAKNLTRNLEYKSCINLEVIR